MHPRWRADGKELFYTKIFFGSSLSAVVMAVDITGVGDGKPFQAGTPHALFQGFGPNDIHPYDVTKDGQQFIMHGTQNPSDAPPVPITVVLNWQSLLKK